MKTHKLTKKEAQRIADLYDLGKVKSVELFSRGLVNFNYQLKTSKGTYVVRIIGHELTTYKKQKLSPRICENFTPISSPKVSTLIRLPPVHPQFAVRFTKSTIAPSVPLQRMMLQLFCF